LLKQVTHDSIRIFAKAVSASAPVRQPPFFVEEWQVAGFPFGKNIRHAFFKPA
jgi:hypothetical protein